ncbi:MAG: hypothetical protein K0S29_679 [Gammaproteobacteria bacterium]|jgi:hypothetical protein|nr:hypothetical protein [Gammaproteobacteria bacterium]
MQFKLIFDGDSLSNHEISPRDLSTALLAIDDLLKEANHILNKGRARVDVKVKGSFETGCFKINLVLSLYDQLKDLLTSNDTEAILNAGEILTLCLSTIPVIKFLKGGIPEKIYENSDGTFSISKAAKQMKIEKKTYDLYKSYKLRKSFENLVSPVVEHPGIQDVAIEYGSKPDNYSIINKEEASYFKCPEPGEEKIDDLARFETSVNIINLSFKEGNKWYVNDGQSSFYAIVEDTSFLQKIDSREISFAKGDILRVQIRREQFYNKVNNSLKTENFIEKVMRHTQAPTNLSLF